MNFRAFAEEICLIKHAKAGKVMGKLRLPLAIGVLGTTGIATKRALEKQTPYDVAMADAYNRSIQQLPPANPGRWM